MFPDNRGELIPNYQRHQGSVLIDEIREQIPNNRWVAANRDGWYIFNETIDELVNEIRVNSQDLSDFAIAFITEDSI